MKFNLSEATGAVQTMINGFLERLPYVAVALIVFLIFFFVSKAVRAGVRALAERNSRRHYNLGLGDGRLSGDIVLEKLPTYCVLKASTCRFRRSRFFSTIRPKTATAHASVKVGPNAKTKRRVRRALWTPCANSKTN